MTATQTQSTLGDALLPAPVAAEPPAIPSPASRRKIFEDTLLLNAAMVGMQVLGVIQSFLVMRVLDPAGYGAWLGLVILLSYAGYAHLGIDNGLGIRIPYLRGRGDESGERNAIDTAFTLWTAATVLFAAGVVGYALFFHHSSPIVRTGLFVVAAIALFQQQGAFFDRCVTSRARFRLASLISLVQSAVMLCTIVPLAYAFGVYGVMAATLISAATTTVLWAVFGGVRGRWRVTRAEAVELLRVGSPLLLVSLSWTLIKTVDRILIVNLLGAESLGFYGITAIGGSFLYGLMQRAGSAISPHITEEMGRSNDDPRALKRFLVKPTLVFAYLSAAAIMVLMFLVPLVVRWALPRYVRGIPALYAFLPGYFFLGITMTAGNILSVTLMARRRQRILIVVQIAALVVEVVGVIAAFYIGAGITGAAAASTLSYVVYGLALLGGAVVVVMDSTRERLAFVVSVLAPFAYGAAVATALLLVQPAVQTITLSAVRVLVAALASLPMIWWLDRRVDLRPELAAVRQRVLRRFSRRVA